MYPIQIKNRSFIKISGEDKESFLQGLITTDIKDPNLYSFMLTPQGKFLFDFFITDHRDYFLLELHKDFMESFLRKMQLYKLRTKVDIEKLEGDYFVYSSNDEVAGQYFSFADPRSAKLGKRFYFTSPLEKYLEEEEYHFLRLKNMIPEGYYDMIQEKSFPLEFGFEKFNAVSFTKGCYVGQEVTARTHYRGKIRKKLQLIEADSFPPKGEEFAGGKMCSASKNLGLVLIREEE